MEELAGCRDIQVLNPWQSSHFDARLLALFRFHNGEFLGMYPQSKTYPMGTYPHLLLPAGSIVVDLDLLTHHEWVKLLEEKASPKRDKP